MTWETIPTSTHKGQGYFFKGKPKGPFLDSLKRELINEGFLEVNFSEELLEQDSMKMTINLGRRYVWKNVAIYEIPFAIQERLPPLKRNHSDLTNWMKQVVF
jgi:hypothetical protein